MTRMSCLLFVANFMSRSFETLPLMIFHVCIIMYRSLRRCKDMRLMADNRSQ